MATHDNASRAMPTWLFLGGLVGLVIGERLSGPGPLRWFSALGALAILVAIVMRGLRMSAATGDRKLVERTLLLFGVVGAFGVVLYAIQSDLAQTLFDKPLDRTSPKLSGVFSVLWPVLVLASVLSTIFVQVAWAAVARAPKLEIARIRDAAMTGLGLAGALTFAFTSVYVATQRDAKVDLSYFRTSRPGESTRKIVQALDQSVDVSIFYPPGNDVREEVEGYFADLAKESPELHVATYDNAVDIAKAKELNVTANGMVVISRAGHKETLNVGLELEAARTPLRNLDKEVQKRLLQVARPGRTVYLVTGHGERSFDPANETDKRLTVREIREVLQSQSYAVRTLGLAEGLGVDVPADAAMVALIGAQQELSAEELASLQRYLDRGGRMLVALDPDVRTDPTQPGGPPVHKELLAKLGLKYDTTPMANDQVYAQRTHQTTERTNIITIGYSSHPSVTTLGKLGSRAPMIMLGAGHLEELKDRDKGTTVDFTVRGHAQTYPDANRNFQNDPGETKKTWELAAAVKRKMPAKDATVTPDPAPTPEELAAEKKDPAKLKERLKREAKNKKDDKGGDEMRAIVVSDSDAFGDGLLGYPGNAYFFLDGVRWLVGDEGITGETSSEVDVPIAHTRKQDQVWFYLCIFVVPALVIGLGALMTRRRRMGARSSSSSTTQKEAA